MEIKCTPQELKELIENKKGTPLEYNSKDVLVDVLLCGKKIN